MITNRNTLIKKIPDFNKTLIKEKAIIFAALFLIEEDFKYILTLKLINKFFNQFINTVTNDLSTQFFDSPHHSSSLHSFFKLADEEVKRLKLGAYFLTQNKNVTMGYLTCLPKNTVKEETIGAGLLSSLKQDVKSAAHTRLNSPTVKALTASFTFQHLVINDSSDIPKEFGFLLNTIINARSYESMMIVLDKIASINTVDRDRVIDEIYRQVAHSYNEREFKRMLANIPIDCNREIGDWVLQIPGEGYYFTQSLFHHAATSGNLSLVNHLIDQDVDASKSPHVLRSIINTIEGSIAANENDPLPFMKHHVENLRLTKACLEELLHQLDSSITSEQAAKRRRC